MQAVRDIFGRLKAWATKNPRVFFLTALAVIVCGVIVTASLLPEPDHSPPADTTAGVSAAVEKDNGDREAEPTVSPVKAVVNGPVEVREFGEYDLSETTLGGILPTSAGLKIVPEQKNSVWSGGWGSLCQSEAEAEKKIATVTWPLGARYSRLKAKIGFLPSDPDVRPGGKYEVYVDGQKVWEKRVSTEDVAMGRAADSLLNINLEGKNALTVRLIPMIYRDTEHNLTSSYWATVPYPVVLYDIELTEKGGGAQ